MTACLERFGYNVRFLPFSMSLYSFYFCLVFSHVTHDKIVHLIFPCICFATWYTIVIFFQFSYSYSKTCDGDRQWLCFKPDISQLHPKTLQIWECLVQIEVSLKTYLNPLRHNKLAMSMRCSSILGKFAKKLEREVSFFTKKTGKLEKIFSKNC